MTKKTDIEALRDVKRWGIKPTGNEHIKYVTAEMPSGPYVKQEDYFNLLKLLEAERQRAGDFEKKFRDELGHRLIQEVKSEAIDEANTRALKAEEELAALRGEQEPAGLIKRKTPLLSDGEFRYSFISDENLPLDTEIFTHPPKPVVVLPAEFFTVTQNTRGMFELSEECMCGITMGLEAAGIVVKGGE